MYCASVYCTVAIFGGPRGPTSEGGGVPARSRDPLYKGVGERKCPCVCPELANSDALDREKSHNLVYILGSKVQKKGKKETFFALGTPDKHVRGSRPRESSGGGSTWAISQPKGQRLGVCPARPSPRAAVPIQQSLKGGVLPTEIYGFQPSDDQS